MNAPAGGGKSRNINHKLSFFLLEIAKFRPLDRLPSFPLPDPTLGSTDKQLKSQIADWEQQN